MQSFSDKQISGANEAIEAFRRDVIRWVILLAQMQSGKTETYLLIACELIRRKLVKNVVIFSGNAETDLRDQLKDQLKVGSKFFEKYVNMRSEEEAKTRNMTSFQEFRMLDTQIREEVTAILSKFIVIWGCELNAYSGPNLDNVFEDMLFIWEEAHHAQSLDQRPAKFLSKIGVSADGNVHCLERNNNYMMTISATPFSELSDNLRQSQGKYVVKMTPGDSYVSVKKIKESGRIVPFTKKEDGIRQALNLEKHSKKWYGIIRFQQKHEDIVKMLVESNGWKWVEYDSVSADRKKGECVWKNMDKEPAENTVILIRGKCRMGKNLEKKHLLFVFETSKQSNTDTVLQSLLGRVCGYSEGSDRVIVYLSNKIVQSGEIERYIEMWDKEGVKKMPTRANNLTDKKVKSHVPIIPVKINLPTGVSRNEYAIKSFLKNVFANEQHKIVSKNSSSVSEELSHKILNGGKLKCYFISPEKKTRNESKARELIDAHEIGIAREFGTGCGIDTEATEVNIWVLPKNLPEFDPNTIYITAHVTRKDIDAFNIPATTGREVFATRLEDKTEVVGNGGMTIRLSSHTANNVTVMQTELCKNMIETSLITQGCDRKVASCWDDREKESKGILVTPEVYKQLQKGGSIYEHVKREYGVLLHTCKSSGLQPKSITARGFIKLASISW
jgi:hypothetical protein